MTGGDHHGHRQQEKQQHQRTPRSSPVEAPSTPVPTTARPLSPPASKYNDRTPPSQPSAPAAPAPTRSVRGAIAKYAPLFVALCGLLAATLVGWVYCSDGGGGWGVRPQSQQTANRGGGGGGGGSGPLLQGDAGKRRRSDSGVDGGGGGWVRFGQVTAGGGRSPSDPAGPNALAPEITEGGGDDETTSTGGGGGDGGGEGGGEGLTRRYGSFEEFASEQYAKLTNNETLDVPIVASPDGPEASRSIPAAIIIGVQKGGTQNLRSHLLTHPLLSGYPGKEAHFFDSTRFRNAIPNGIEWEGDGRDEDPLKPRAVGRILSAYADKAMDAMAPGDRDTLAGVDSSPVYVFHPLVPYRIKMVLPRVKFVLLLRDPTERYFSHLRMAMCTTRLGESFESTEQRSRTYFHTPGPETTKQYLEQGGALYEPYTALCRGEGATPGDLQGCWQRQQKTNPLQRGLYADQLERWFRVFSRDQIMVIESGEMFADFTGTLDRVAHHVGLPPHDFEYNAGHQHASSVCEQRRAELFAKGARYDQMLKDAEYFREWYRPHNQRLFELLGREMPWA